MPRTTLWTQCLKGDQAPGVSPSRAITKSMIRSTEGNLSTDKDTEAFRLEVARAFGAIGRSLEVMQANLFITRAMVDLLDERNLLPIGEVRSQAHKLALAAAVSPGALSALEQMLAEEGSAIPNLLQ